MTKLIDGSKGEDFTFTVFPGGVFSKGESCFQITIQHHQGSIGPGTWIQLTEPQMRNLLLAFCAHSMGITWPEGA